MQNSSVNASGESTTKKLSKEEIDHSTQRLYTMGMRKEKALPPIVKPTKLTKDLQQSSVQRLYHDSIEIARKNQTVRTERYHKKDAVETKIIPDEEVHDMVGRLYDQSIKNRKNNLEALHRKQEKDMDRGVGRKLNGSDINAMANRLYGESPQQAQAKKMKLYEKYVTDHLPKSKKVAPEDAAEYANRLYRNEKA